MNQKTASAPAAENKMGTMPIGRLLFNMSLPMMVSMLVQALYNIVRQYLCSKAVRKCSYRSLSRLPVTDAAHCSCNRYRRRYECTPFQSTRSKAK